MTTSNHRPYHFPDGRIDLPQGRRDAAVKYTDWAIGGICAPSTTTQLLWKEAPRHENLVLLSAPDPHRPILLDDLLEKRTIAEERIRLA